MIQSVHVAEIKTYTLVLHSRLERYRQCAWSIILRVTTRVPYRPKYSVQSVGLMWELVQLYKQGGLRIELYARLSHGQRYMAMRDRAFWSVII